MTQPLRAPSLERACLWIRGNIPFLVYIALCLYQMSYFRIEAGDYLGFQKELEQCGTVLATLTMRWETWSSRVLIDTAVYSLLNETVIWQILTFTCFVLAFYSLNALVRRWLGSLSGWIVLAALLCYPMIDMNSAGWYATLPNYYWPLSCGLYTLLSCARELGIVEDAKRIVPRWLHAAITVLLAFFAASMELLAAAMTGILLLALAWGIKKGRRPVIIVLCLIASCTGIAMALLCPGNAMRSAAETQTWWPAFSNLSFFEKIAIGLGSTMGEYLQGTRPIILVFSAVAAASIYAKRGRSAASVFSLVPLLTFLLIPELIRRGFVGNGLLDALVLTDFGRENMGHALPAFSALLVALILIEGYLLYGKSWKFVAFLGIGGTGLATRVAMGLSPTLFDSGERTFLFCDFALVGITLMLLADYLDIIPKKFRCALYSFIVVCCAFSTVTTMELIWSVAG